MTNVGHAPARHLAFAGDVDDEPVVAPSPVPIRHPVRSLAIWIVRLALVGAWSVLGAGRPAPEPTPSPPRHRALVVPELEIGASERKARGRRLFHDVCRPCHGPVADGNGLGAAGLKIRPADLRAKKLLLRATPEPLYWTIREGVSDTPMAGCPALSDDDTWDLVAWILSGTP